MINWYEVAEAAFCIGLFLIFIVLAAGFLVGQGPFAVFM